MNENKYIIIGCGGHARSVADVIMYNNSSSELLFLDTNARMDEKILGFPVLSTYNITDEKVIVAIGNNKKRAELSQKYYNNLTNIISTKAYIGKNAILGKGIFIGHNAFVGTLAEIDDFCIINTNATVEHECKLKKTVFIAPGATILGKVTIEENSFIAANATVRDNIKICSNCIIGIGTSVITDINNEGIYVGSPAKCMREKK